MTGKLFIKTYGCQMNTYDSSRMADALAKSHQLELCDTPEEADVVLFNTCSIREKAQEKVFSELGLLHKMLKRNKKKAIIGVGGCVASQEGATIQKRAPYVDIVFGPQTLHRLPEMLEEVRKNKRAVMDISFPEIEKFDCLPKPRADGPSAYVSIMEGCSKYCSYCVVPYTRGEEISRPFDDVIAEAVSLAEQGVREITLLGQNVNDYQGVMHTGDIADLALLINYVAAIDGIDRIRFTTSHPLAFSDNLVQAYADVPALANQLHLPVQSGSDRILAAMKRGYTAIEFKSKIRRLRKVRPDISITSDFIVGFPGETEEEFMATMDLIAQVGFDGGFSFIFSPRPGTPAAQLEDLVPLEEKKRRLKLLQTRILAQQYENSLKMVDREHLILVTGRSKKREDELQGRTENNRIVNFKGSPELIGQFLKVKIINIQPNSLRGELA
jgi:tRNA-2-methylthio-N6-dimethylallyladenosine synthase